MTQPTPNLRDQSTSEGTLEGQLPDAEGPPPPPPPRRPITWKNGGWLFALLVGVSLLAMGSMLFLFPRHRGDGKHVESYGFELSKLSVPREQIIPAGIPRDYFVALENPATYNLEQVAQENKKNSYRKFLLEHDRVLGVQVGGEARAYPLNTLRLHGVINDTLGGQPILVTYDTLCDSAAVFARYPFGQSGVAALNPPRFGVSGLVYNSNMLIYDHQPARGGGESLWIQMEGQAISGPGLGRQLPRLAFVLTSWKAWLRGHPETRVMAPEPVSEQPFKNSIFTPYFTTDTLNYPVSPAWDVRRYPNKSPVLAVRWVSPGQVGAEGAWRVFVIPGLAKLTAEERERVLAVPGIKMNWEEDAGVEVGGGSLWAEPTKELVGREPGGHLETVYGFLFAWYGLHPGEGMVP